MIISINMRKILCKTFHKVFFFFPSLLIIALLTPLHPDVARLIVDQVIAGNRVRTKIFKLLLPDITSLRVTEANFSFKVIAERCPNLTEYADMVKGDAHLF